MGVGGRRARPPVDGETGAPATDEPAIGRRDAVRRGLAAGGAVLAACTIPAALPVAPALAAADGDAAILSRAITVESTAVAAYEAALKSSFLDRHGRAVATLLRRHEQEHVDVLSRALTGLGGTPPTGAGADARALAPLRRIGDQVGFLHFAIGLETVAVAAYYAALGKLRDARLLRTGAQIMAAEGQHLVVLREALGRNPAPHAFETGKRSA